LIPSPNHESRAGSRVDLVIIHTAEGATTAAGLGNYFANPAVEVSSHVGIDDSTTEQYVSYDQAAWGALNANHRSDQAELCGFARWSRDEWLNNHRGMLDRAADWIRERCAARGIPIRKLSPADVDAGASGVIGHVDWSLSNIGQGDHTDPGPGFPWDYVIGRASGGAPAQPPAQTSGAGPFPLPRNEYFGLITGPAASHGGYYAWEKPHIARIQRALQAKGYAPNYASWADGIYEQPTANAVAAWQRREMPGTTRFGEVWWDDWAALLA